MRVRMDCMVSRKGYLIFILTTTHQQALELEVTQIIGRDCTETIIRLTQISLIALSLSLHQ